MKSLKDLKQKAIEMTVLLPLMEGLEKGEMSSIIEGEKPVTIMAFGFVDLKDGKPPFVAFTIKEEEGKFFFGGKVLTENLAEMQMEGYEETINKEGLPTLFGTKKPAKGNAYTTVKFFPEA